MTFRCVVILFLAASHATADELLSEAPINKADRSHWSFRPLARPPLPKVSRPSWCLQPIDRFVLARLEERKLSPAPPADLTTLIRRLTFDLLGLPPTPEEIDAFLADRDRGAYERLVDRLLASPHYGEHVGQRWLDLARFAETDGFEHDGLRKQAWKYRDWVIEAFNNDLPYDRFIQLQLAADEVEPPSAAARVATAFCLSGPDMPDINSQVERTHNLLNEMTATVGAVFLGLQIGCAQCHDHKYDPISQGDFYRMRAVFEPAVHVEKGESVSVLREVLSPPSKSHLMIRGDWRRRGPEVKPAYPRIANPQGAVFPAGDGPAGDGPAGDGPAGDGPETSGRRAAFASWLTRDDHPLTARVIANRLWQHHFANGLSRTPSDFGRLGNEPSHLELLDWLATEIVHGRWNLKRIHRLLVTSATYRQSNQSTTPADADSKNVNLSRFSRRRLSGEAIRDAMLVAGGVLDTRRGGPGVRPPLPRELVSTLLKNQWNVSENEADHFRRSIYVFVRRNLRYPIFDAFDRPDGNASCPRRNQSTTAPQSLLMLNSEFSLSCARRFSAAVLAKAAEGRSDPSEIAFRRAFGRRPSPSEHQALRQFLSRQAAFLRAEGRPPEELALPLPCSPEEGPHEAAAMTDLCLALFNANEFLYVD